jgi:hypothetical protein
MKRICLLPILAAAAAIAGPFDQPYAIITTDTRPAADPNLRPVIVNRVDGENAMDHRAVVAPGVRKVTVDLPPRKGFHTATQHTFDLEAKPCVRYHVAAKLASTTTQGWKPVIRSEERIVECETKFKVAAGK